MTGNDYLSRAGTIIHEDAEMMHTAIPDVFSQLSGSNVLVTGASGFLGSLSLISSRP
jgi:hypothetical protein